MSNRFNRRAFSYGVVCFTPGTGGERLNERSAQIVARDPEEARETARRTLGAPESDSVLVNTAFELGPAEAALWNDWHASTEAVED